MDRLKVRTTLLERIEQPRQQFRLDADPRVLDVDVQPALRAIAELHADTSPVGHELGGVGQQVGEHLLQPGGVGPYKESLARAEGAGTGIPA